jgi:DNA repair exonuclease SbcCD ATPase subunit
MLDSAAKRTNELQSDNQRLREELARLKQTQIECNASREKAMNDSNADKRKLCASVVELTSQLNEAHRQSEKGNTRIAELRTELERKANEVGALEENVSKLMMKMETDGNIRNVDDKRHATQVEALSLELTGVQHELQQTKQQLQEAKRSSDEQKRVINDLTKSVQDQKHKLSIMQQNAEEITSSLDTNPDAQTAAKLRAHYNMQVKRIVNENPNCVPIRCVRAENCKDYPLLERKKLAVSKDMTLSRFNEHIRQKLSLAPEKPLSVYVDCESLPCPNTEVIGELYEQCKHADGFLRLKYSNTSDI